jgi:hypothetical protein
MRSLRFSIYFAASISAPLKSGYAVCLMLFHAALLGMVAQPTIFS